MWCLGLGRLRNQKQAATKRRKQAPSSSSARLRPVFVASFFPVVVYVSWCLASPTLPLSIYIYICVYIYMYTYVATTVATPYAHDLNWARFGGHHLAWGLM